LEESFILINFLLNNLMSNHILVHVFIERVLLFASLWLVTKCQLLFYHLVWSIPIFRRYNLT